MKNYIPFILLFFFQSQVFSQNIGVIKGKVRNAISNETIPFANIIIQGKEGVGATSDIDGNYEIKNLKPDVYNLEVSYVGFKKKVIYEIQVFNFKPTYLNINLDEDIKNLEAVEIVAETFRKTEESPVSLRSIGANEIERNPGGNRDISKAIQSLPGVSSTAAFRNDIIIRGGAPNENRFYLDGVEVPLINHFSTQGASGGPVGILNVNLIKEVDFYSSAFPANRGNAGSSVFEFYQKDGSTDKWKGNFVISGTDIGLAMDGPLSEKTTLLFSARRSYLQFLFSALGLPFLPTFNGFQFKTKTKIDAKNELTFVGIGAIDNSALNLSANETDEQKYILANIPVNNQWNYTVGGVWKHFKTKSFQTYVLSRTMLNNEAYKFENNDESNPNGKILDYRSREIENKFRFENTWRDKGWKVNMGVNAEYATYTNRTFNRISTPQGLLNVDFNSTLFMVKGGLFGQVSKGVFNERMTLSLGLRTDFNDYNTHMINPLNQLSPRFSASYTLTDKWSLNASVGRFYQLPPYTVLGYRNNMSELVNQPRLKYIEVNHLVAGIEYRPWNNARITVEGFYKIYNNYPFLLRDSISLANLGGDFGVVGNEEAASISQGRSYGAEILLQQKLYKGFFGIVAFTLVRSEFTDRTQTFKPSAWDNQFLLTLTGGKKWNNGWELGLRWRLVGGTPYTPIDINRSSLRPVWDITSRGLPDYTQLNSQRLQAFNQLDVRLDKKWYFNKWNFNLFLDIQNFFNSQQIGAPNLDVVRDITGNPTIDPNDNLRYQTRLIQNSAGRILPTIGVIVDF
jgi:hypothetical protein